MALQSVSTGEDPTLYTFATGLNNRNVVSFLPLNENTARQTGAIGSSLRPIRIRDMQIYFRTSAGNIFYKLANAQNTADVWTSATFAANSGTNITTAINRTVNYAAFTTTTLYFGFRTQDTLTTRIVRGNVGSTMWLDGTTAPGPIRADIWWETVPSAPGTPSLSSRTSTSITIAWTAPGDNGGTAINGYRVLYKRAVDSTWISTGKFTGTSRTISGLTANTSYNFMVAATNAASDSHNSDYSSNTAHTGSNSATFTVSTNPPLPVFTDSTVASPAIRGVAYSDGVSASNATSYSVRNSANTGAGTLPAGLSLNTSTGAITGTPTTLGSTSFRIRATNVTGSTDTASLTIVVNPPAPVFTDATVASPAIRDASYTDGVAATDATSYSVRNSANTGAGTLPAGLSLNTSTGAITGTPTTLGSTSFRIRATNVTGSTDTASLTIVVNPPAPVFSDSTVVETASVGSEYSDGVLATDAASYSVFSGSLPNGISLNTSTGAITGTPTTAGVFNFVIRATNVTGSTNTSTLTITVTSGARVWNGTTFVSGTTRVWNGTTFVSGTTRVWNGSGWVSAS